MIIQDAVLRSQFKAAAEERLQNLEVGLLHLEQQEDNAETLETLLRELRSLESDSTQVSLDSVAPFIQELGNLLESLYRKDIPLTLEIGDRLHEQLNAIHQLVYEAATVESANKTVDTDRADINHSRFMDAALSISDPWLEDPLDFDPLQTSSPISQVEEIPDEAALFQARRLPETTDQHDGCAQERCSQQTRAQAVSIPESHLRESIDSDSSVDSDNFVPTPPFLDKPLQAASVESSNVQGLLDSTPPMQGALDQDDISSPPLDPPDPELLPLENLPQGPPAHGLPTHEALAQGQEPSALDLAAQALLNFNNLVQETPEPQDSPQPLLDEDILFQGAPIGPDQYPERPAPAELSPPPLELQTLCDSNNSAPEPPAPENSPHEPSTQAISDQRPTPPETLVETAPIPHVPAQESVALSSLDPEPLEDYKATNLRRLQHLESGLLQLATVIDDEPVLNDILQEIRQLKSDSRHAGLETMVTLAQQFENVVEGVQRKKLVLSIELCAHLYEALKAMEQWVEGSGPDISEVLVKTTVPQDAEDALPRSETVLPLPSMDDPPQSMVDKIDALLKSVPAISEDAELREIYKSISEGRLQKLEAGLARLETFQDEATLAELLREAHSLKGDSRSVGVNAVEILTHNFESILVGVQNGRITFTPALSHSLYLGLAAIAQMVNEANIHPTNGETPASSPNSSRSASPEAKASDEEPTNLSIHAQTTPQSQPIPMELNPSYPNNTISVETDDLDHLMNQVEELAIARLQVAHTAAQFDQMAMIWQEWSNRQNQAPSSNPANANSLETQIEHLITALKSSAQANSAQLGIISEDLREGIGALRLLPLSTLFERFPRLVQDVARRQSKRIEFEMEGGETPIEKHLIEEVYDVLMHLICNAVDHGVETPAERESRHKPPTAKICLRAYQGDAGPVIEVVDDGQGLDIEQIKQIAINRHLYTLDELEAMPLDQIQALILKPGFSTRTEVTELSGRGVGLDVVRTHIERLRGRVQIDSIPGQGCTFRLHLGSEFEAEAYDGALNDPCFVS